MRLDTAACAAGNRPVRHAASSFRAASSGTAPATSVSASAVTAPSDRRAALCSEVMARRMSPLATLLSACMAPGTSVTPSAAERARGVDWGMESTEHAAVRAPGPHPFPRRPTPSAPGHEAPAPFQHLPPPPPILPWQMCWMRSLMTSPCSGLNRNFAHREASGSMMRDT